MKLPPGYLGSGREISILELAHMVDRKSGLRNNRVDTRNLTPPRRCLEPDFRCYHMRQLKN